MARWTFTSESVTEGHPDKMADQISDAIVDRFLAEDPCARIDAECAVSNGVLFVATQANSRASVDVTFTARQTIAGIGYTPEELDSENCTILTTLGDNLAARPSDRHEVELSGSDLDGIVEMSETIARIGKEERGRYAKVTASIANFVPKAHTPFQWNANHWHKPH